MQYANERYRRIVITFATLHAGLIREYLASDGDSYVYSKLMMAKSAAIANLEKSDEYQFGALISDAIRYVREHSDED